MHHVPIWGVGRTLALLFALGFSLALLRFPPRTLNLGLKGTTHHEERFDEGYRANQCGGAEKEAYSDAELHGYAVPEAHESP